MLIIYNTHHTPRVCTSPSYIANTIFSIYLRLYTNSIYPPRTTLVTQYNNNMDPATLNDQVSKRQQLLRNRALDRGTQLCIENMNAEKFNKMVYMPHLQKQIEVVQTREPKILDSDANFIFRVLKERTLIAMEQDRLRATKTIQQQEDDKAHAFTVEQHQKFEVDQRYRSLHQAFINNDHDRSGFLPATTIRNLCRAFQVESNNVDNVMTLAQKNSYGELSYLSFAERLKSMDFPNDLNATQSKRLVVDEWGTLANTQADIVDTYEQQKEQIALDLRVQNSKDLRQQADVKEMQKRKFEQEMKRRERAMVDQSYVQYEEEQQMLAARKIQMRQQENNTRKNQILLKQQRMQKEKREIQEWSKQEVDKAIKVEQDEYINNLKRKEQERREWTQAKKVSDENNRRKQAEIQAEREEDKQRMLEWEQILKKEDEIRRANLLKATTYKPPEAIIKAAKGVTEKAKEDEKRAYQIQQIRENELIKMDQEAEARRKMAEIQMFNARKEQEILKQKRLQQEKQRDVQEVDALMEQVQYTLRLEQEQAIARRKANSQYGQELKQQAEQYKKSIQRQKGRMSSVERSYNKQMIQETMSPRQSTFSNTARRIFG
jgi:hypothetical protein